MRPDRDDEDSEDKDKNGTALQAQLLRRLLGQLSLLLKHLRGQLALDFFSLVSGHLAAPVAFIS